MFMYDSEKEQLHWQRGIKIWKMMAPWGTGKCLRVAEDPEWGRRWGCELK